MIALLTKAFLIIVVLLAFYKLFLEKESFFGANRIYLLGCLIFAGTLPFITLPKHVEYQGVISNLIELSEEKDTTYTKGTVPLAEERTTSQEILSHNFDSPILKALGSSSEETGLEAKSNSDSEQQVSEVSTPEDNQWNKGVFYWFRLLYYFGVLILSLKLIAQVAHMLWKIYANKDKIEDEGGILVNMDEDIEPCSFFSYILINPGSYDYATYEQIIAHEKIHIRQWHTIDLLLSELAVIALWFNPFIWLLRKEVEKNLEFQTDDIMVREDAAAKETYQLNLLKIATKTEPLTITTNYNQSLLKQRILKMNTKKSNHFGYWKYSFIAPMIFILLLLLNQPKIGNSQNATTFIPLNTIPEVALEQTDSITDCGKLIDAIHEQNIAQVRELLKTVDPNCIEPPAPNDGFLLFYAQFNPEAKTKPKAKTYTPLTTAARLGYLEIAKLLVEAGADVELYDDGLAEGSPLMEASGAGHLDLVKLLVNNGADVHKVTNNEGSALQHAARGGHLKIVSYLLEKGADINAPKFRIAQGTPISNAAMYGHTEVVSFLMDKGADIYIPNSTLGSALHAAAFFGRYETVEMIISKGVDVNAQEKIDLNMPNEDPGSALKGAAMRGHNEIVELLLANGANINLRNGKSGMTALIAATWYKHIETVELLLANGADINLKDKEFGTALAKASNNGDIEMVKLLLSKGAKIDLYSEEQVHEPARNSQMLFSPTWMKKVEDDKQCTALIAAAKHGYIEIVKLLLSEGANIDLQTDAQGTALNAAARNGHNEIVEVLLENGADINLQNGGQGSPLNAAARKRYNQTVELLLSKGANIEQHNNEQGSALNAAARNGHNKTVELLLSKGADINAQNDGQGSALNAAAKYGQNETVKLLLSKGADINVQNDAQGSALNAAARNGQAKTVELLLSRGANVNALNDGQGSALNAAARNGHLETIKLLVSKGADVNLSCKGEGTAVDAAYRNAHQHIVTYLEAQGGKRVSED